MILFLKKQKKPNQRRIHANRENCEAENKALDEAMKGLKSK